MLNRLFGLDKALGQRLEECRVVARAISQTGSIQPPQTITKPCRRGLQETYDGSQQEASRSIPSARIRLQRILRGSHAPASCISAGEPAGSWVLYCLYSVHLERLLHV